MLTDRQRRVQSTKDRLLRAGGQSGREGTVTYKLSPARSFCGGSRYAERGGDECSITHL